MFLISVDITHQNVFGKSCFKVVPEILGLLNEGKDFFSFT